ncbi:hypothetical protein BOX15_Mlig012315g3 [Macrostomum lignano]|uniref:Innexin n=1 Tax=Macrostomum lignano TaxID=282301 RepID=A0A267FSM3_9PLAT|nr:hypothetical protein BOX15_Mlig012315g3 [Macrostomum lignano]
MDGYLSSFTKLAGAAKSVPHGAEDYYDRLNYALTPGILLAIATIIGMKQYVFEPIQCWTLKELDDQRMQYAENYCWVENTFYFDPDVPIGHTNKPGEGRTIYYYQWVPFILMAQAVLFYVPHLLWLMLSTNVGVDMRQLAEQARKLESDCLVGDERKTKVAFLASSLLRFFRYRSRYGHENACKRLTSFLLGKPAFAMYLLAAYVLVKACYIANCIGQLYLMRSYLGLNMTSFGLQIFNDIANNRTWQTTNVFPRVTYCHFEVRNVGAPRSYILQCVLPVNMLNEKFYVVIWFWVVIMLSLNIVSLTRWLVKLMVSPSRRRIVKKYLKIAEVIDSDGKKFSRNKAWECEFVDDLIRSDGTFLLSVINKNAGDIVTAEVVRKTFELWHSQSTELDSPAESAKYITDEKMPLDPSAPKAVIV